MKICSIDDCLGKHKGLGFCEMHYYRYKRGADLHAPRQRLPKGVTQRQGQYLRRHARKLAFQKFKAVPCQDCAHTFPPECMDFDHVRGTKKFTIADGNGYFRKWQDVLDEIAKCDIVCSNCHRIRTASRRQGKFQGQNWASTSTHLAAAVSQLAYAEDVAENLP